MVVLRTLKGGNVGEEVLEHSPVTQEASSNFLLAG
jgi:hypothetical protein